MSFEALADVQRLSVFPLFGVLLLPRMHLPLHIFEPRYKALVSDAMARDRRIGMVQPRAAGDPPPLAYRSAAEEARFHALTAELRCVQCQNQSLADSHAQIAMDLRREVLELMHQDKRPGSFLLFP